MATTWFLTGATRGLGLEMTRQLAERGDTIFACARDPGRATELAALAKAHPGVIITALDVSSPPSVDRAAKELGGRSIDVLVNNAGVMGEDETINELSWDELARVFQVNTFAPAMVTRALLPNLRAGRGRKAVNISSQLGSITNCASGFSYAYRASKAALNMLTASMAKDLVRDKITVVSICPGWNRTDMGGANAPLHPKDSMRMVIGVIDSLKGLDSGSFLTHEGKKSPW